MQATLDLEGLGLEFLTIYLGVAIDEVMRLIGECRGFIVSRKSRVLWGCIRGTARRS